MIFKGVRPGEKSVLKISRRVGVVDDFTPRTSETTTSRGLQWQYAHGGVYEWSTKQHQPTTTYVTPDGGGSSRFHCPVRPVTIWTDPLTRFRAYTGPAGAWPGSKRNASYIVSPGGIWIMSLSARPSILYCRDGL